MNTNQNPFSLHRENQKGYNLVASQFENILQLNSLNSIYHSVKSANSKLEFIDNVLDHLSIDIEYPEHRLLNIPRDKKIIIVSNHPFGGIEGLVLYKIISQVRPDFKIMANYLLKRIPELADIFIAVDPFGGGNAINNNYRPLKEAMRWLNSEKALGIFPAGEVSSLHLNKGMVTDPKWNTNIVNLSTKTNATIIPVFFHGQNSTLFNILGLAHPALRTAMLPREFLNKENTMIQMQIGNPISPSKLKRFETIEDKARYLRVQTYMLANRYEKYHNNSFPEKPPKKEIINSGYTSGELAAEIKNLSTEEHLLNHDNFSVFCASANKIPCVLNEIGRLREITFRAVGEGSGKSIDLDNYDRYYKHLFMWDNTEEKIVGAYRIGLANPIIQRFGKKGLYTFSLFKMRKKLFKRMTPAMELGRSFITEEYQKSFAPLLLLWKGIGHFIVQNPEYRYLFGPVSISSSYTSASRKLIVDFLKEKYMQKKWAKWIKPRQRPEPSTIKGFSIKKEGDLVPKIEDLNHLISIIEDKNADVPILLKQYLKLNGKILSFNTDPDFNDALDALIVVDLHKTPKKALEKYMGKPGLTKYLIYNKLYASKDEK